MPDGASHGLPFDRGFTAPHRIRFSVIPGNAPDHYPECMRGIRRVPRCRINLHGLNARVYPAFMAHDRVEAFHRSLLGIPASLNSARAEIDLPPIQSSSVLDIAAYERACYFMVAGMRDYTVLADTVQPFKGYDLTEAVELVRQWPAIKQAPEYMQPWANDKLAGVVLTGDYRFMGVAGEIVLLEKPPFMKAIVVLILTNHAPN